MEAYNENIFDGEGEWEGQVTQIKKHTEIKINQATEEMMSGIKQIADKGWDQEIKQTNQERELKMTMQKVSMENLKMNQKIEKKVDRIHRYQMRFFQHANFDVHRNAFIRPWASITKNTEGDFKQEDGGSISVSDAQSARQRAMSPLNSSNDPS